MILPVGVGTRYFDPKRSCYALKFVPFFNLFVKSESKAGTAFAKKVLIEKAKEFLGVDIEVAVAGFDASDAFLGGLAPSKSHFTDYAHVSRKLKTETGKDKIKCEKNLEYLSRAIDLLHVCSTAEQFKAFATVVIDELAKRDEHELVAYLTKVGMFVCWCCCNHTQNLTPSLTLIPTLTAPISHA